MHGKHRIRWIWNNYDYKPEAWENRCSQFLAIGLGGAWVQFAFILPKCGKLYLFYITQYPFNPPPPKKNSCGNVQSHGDMGFVPWCMYLGYEKILSDFVEFFWIHIPVLTSIGGTGTRNQARSSTAHLPSDPSCVDWWVYSGIYCAGLYTGRS